MRMLETIIHSLRVHLQELDTERLRQADYFKSKLDEVAETNRVLHLQQQSEIESLRPSRQSAGGKIKKAKKHM